MNAAKKLTILDSVYNRLMHGIHIDMICFILIALSQVRICRPFPPLRSDNLDMKDAQCAETKDERKISYHVISRLDAMGVQKGRFWPLEFILFSKVAKFAVKIGKSSLFCIQYFFLCDSQFLRYDRFCIFSFLT